jgi:hypothetical protein
MKILLKFFKKRELTAVNVLDRIDEISYADKKTAVGNQSHCRDFFQTAPGSVDFSFIVHPF